MSLQPHFTIPPNPAQQHPSWVWFKSPKAPAPTFADWFAWSSAYARAAGINTVPCPYRIGQNKRTLFWRDRTLCATTRPESLLAVAEWYIMFDWADRLSENCLVCHAAVVEQNGRALLLVGKGGAGKSTLALALVRRGFRYLGDEFAIVQPAILEVLPFPKALCIKSSGVAMIPSPDPDFEVMAYPPNFSSRYKDALCCLPRKHIVPAPGERFEIRWAILLESESVSGSPAVVPRWEAAKSLYESSWQVGEEPFRAAAALARGARFWKMGRSDLAHMADWIEGLVDSDSAVMHSDRTKLRVE